MTTIPSAPVVGEPAAPPPPPSAPPGGLAFDALALAGVASLGAGAIHAAAIGVHNDQQSVVVTFALLAAFQLAWGGGALIMRPAHRLFLALGIIGHGAALVGWLLAKTSGIGFISGLAEAESVQLADTSAAALALVAGLLTARELLMPAGLPQATRSPARSFLPVAVFPILVLTMASMISAGSHSHAGGHGHGDEVAGDHAHGEGEEASGDHAHAPAVNPGPFDPEDPIDLSGVPGVSAQEQAEAEDLLRRSLDRLPQFSNISALNDKGYYSIGDAITGDEHYVNWSYLNDDKILDPDYPESLVIRHEGDDQTLVAAMFMLPDGTTLDEVPDVGGDLVQWHVHNDLCFTDDPVAPTLAYDNLIVGAEEECTPPNAKRGDVPMVHVWIVPHPCGPFAALEGLGGGQIAQDEEKLCTAEHSHAVGS